MKEKRIKRRMKDEENEHELVINVISNTRNPEEKIITRDVSATGAKIQTNINLPVDTLLNMKFKLKDLEEKINAIGKVKWIRVVIEDEAYEVGVEFVNAPIYAIQILEDYIDWKLESEKLKILFSFSK
ncbi:MAG TPA: PilZ domain-containing protein [Smithella sp.]|nr:PilZ domain-containing protein [Smithella sp.]MDM7987314.1 PilZ domain-containing protein [Smithella sp.]HNY50016.1 PilZ domain-containing protein [Smithella sp.]HOG89773.1 PilZ domain-containing protein [Smithella sp.]HOU50070.1 PilZ domain-containing protein [Smithella sp.]